jgi:hypothetical protein
MKVRLLTTFSGPAGAGQAGEIKTLPDEFAAALILGGYAVEVESPPKAEAEPSTVEAPKQAKPDGEHEAEKPKGVEPKRRGRR